jgi:hypothetical protein
VPEHDTFYVVKQHSAVLHAIITVLHEVPAGAQELGSFSDLIEAIDFAQQTAHELRAAGMAVEYVDPPDDLVGTG